MSQSTIGAKYFDTVNDPQGVTLLQQATERFSETLETFNGLLEDELDAHPLGSNQSEPSGIPEPTETLKVTKWLGVNGIWHWVETPKGSLEPGPWQDLHSARVAAAKAEYPPAS